MIKYHLKLIFRHLVARKIYSMVILLSLSVGFVCSATLIAFLVYEKGTDAFHDKHERIVQIFSDDPFADNGKISFIIKPFAEYTHSNYPEIEKMCQVNLVRDASLEHGQVTRHDDIILAADSTFFTLFDFPLAQGDRRSCLAPGQIVLSWTNAEAIFGTTDVLNEVLTLHTPDTVLQLRISGVVKMPVENSHLRFDALVHPSLLGKKWFGGVTYALLSDGNAAAQLQAKINDDDQRPSLVGPGKGAYFLNPLTDSYFNGDNKMPFMKTRSAVFINVVYWVCGLIFFISGFNFINLILLFGQNRRKDVGVSKTFGMSRGQMVIFSIVEASVYIIVSSLLAAVAIWVIIPVFNAVFESGLSVEYLLSIKVLAPIVGAVALCALVATIIMVLQQWSVKPVSLMGKGVSKIRFSRLLFTIQFVIAITLAICAVTIVQQVDHLKNAPLGFNRSLVQLNGPGSQYSELLPVLKQRVAQLPDVNNVTVGGGNPVSGNAIVRLELEDGRFYSPYLFGGDEDFLKTLHLQLVEGRFPSDENGGVVVNEAFVRKFEFDNPIGEKVPGDGRIIAGVVKNFTVSSFKQEIPPSIISYYKNGRALLIDYTGNDLGRLISQLGTEWKKVFPGSYFDYQVVQMDLMKKYRDDIFLFKIVISFSIVSILLSCFGLFALSWAVVQNRTKEMGIRKVLGADASDVLLLLSSSFVKHIAIAFLIAAPIGYFFMDRWLTGFVNRIDFGLSVFLVSAVIMFIVSAATMSIHTIKAALINPVDELRAE